LEDEGLMDVALARAALEQSTIPSTLEDLPWLIDDLLGRPRFSRCPWPLVCYLPEPERYQPWWQDPPVDVQRERLEERADEAYREMQELLGYQELLRHRLESGEGLYDEQGRLPAIPPSLVGTYTGYVLEQVLRGEEPETDRIAREREEELRKKPWERDEWGHLPKGVPGGEEREGGGDQEGPLEEGRDLMDEDLVANMPEEAPWDEELLRRGEAVLARLEEEERQAQLAGQVEEEEEPPQEEEEVIDLSADVDTPPRPGGRTAALDLDQEQTEDEVIVLDETPPNTPPGTPPGTPPSTSKGGMEQMQQQQQSPGASPSQQQWQQEQEYVLDEWGEGLEGEGLGGAPAAPQVVVAELAPPEPLSEDQLQWQEEAIAEGQLGLYDDVGLPQEPPAVAAAAEQVGRIQGILEELDGDPYRYCETIEVAPAAGEGPTPKGRLTDSSYLTYCDAQGMPLARPMRQEWERGPLVLPAELGERLHPEVPGDEYEPDLIPEEEQEYKLENPYGWDSDMEWVTDDEEVGAGEEDQQRRCWGREDEAGYLVDEDWGKEEDAVVGGNEEEAEEGSEESEGSSSSDEESEEASEGEGAGDGEQDGMQVVQANLTVEDMLY
jgi:hypothetical protein